MKTTRQVPGYELFELFATIVGACSKDSGMPFKLRYRISKCYGAFKKEVSKLERLRDDELGSAYRDDKGQLLMGHPHVQQTLKDLRETIADVDQWPTELSNAKKWAGDNGDPIPWSSLELATLVELGFLVDDLDDDDTPDGAGAGDAG